MASLQMEKVTASQLTGMSVHYCDDLRKIADHTNKDIDQSKTYLNYNIGLPDYRSFVKELNQKVTEIDKIEPPERVRKDRKVCLIVEAKCPQEIADKKLENEYFHSLYNFLNEKVYEGNIMFGQVHKDEAHEYYKKEKSGDINTHTSLYHMDMFVLPHKSGKGINMKTYNNQARIAKAQKLTQDFIAKKYGISYNNGNGKDSRTIEDMKFCSGKLEEIAEREKGIEEADEYMHDREISIDNREHKLQERERRNKELTEEIEASKAELRNVNNDISDYFEKIKPIEKVVNDGKKLLEDFSNKIIDIDKYFENISISRDMTKEEAEIKQRTEEVKNIAKELGKVVTDKDSYNKVAELLKQKDELRTRIWGLQQEKEKERTEDEDYER